MKIRFESKDLDKLFDFHPFPFVVVNTYENETIVLPTKQENVPKQSAVKSIGIPKNPYEYFTKLLEGFAIEGTFVEDLNKYLLLVEEFVDQETTPLVENNPEASTRALLCAKYLSAIELRLKRLFYGTFEEETLFLSDAVIEKYLFLPGVFNKQEAFDSTFRPWILEKLKDKNQNPDASTIAELIDKDKWFDAYAKENLCAYTQFGFVSDNAVGL